MDILKQRKRTIFVVVALSCIAMSVVTLNSRTPTFFENLLLFVTSPAQGGVAGATGWIEGRISFVANMHELERANQLLMEENQRLRIDIGRLEMLERENERLTAQIGLKPQYVGLELIGAYVMAADPNNWSSYFRINRGTNHDVFENSVVLADGGLVGRVLRASQTSSLVIPIIDDTSIVSAQIRRTGEFGFVQGDIRLWEDGFIRMANIPINADILENDEIITSVLGEIFPFGITIGHVREIHMDPGGLTKHAIVQPVADFRQLSVVFVTTDADNDNDSERDEELYP